LSGSGSGNGGVGESGIVDGSWVGPVSCWPYRLLALSIATKA
jgi:hypothetical protein